MDKKTIRSIPILEFDGDTTEAIFRSDLRQVLTTRVESAAGERVLVVNIYDIEEINSGEKRPVTVTYLWADNFISRYRKDGQYIWRTGMIDKPLVSCYWRQQHVFHTVQDENTVCAFFGSEEHDPIEIILAFQRDVRHRELQARHDIEKKEINNALAPVKELPIGFSRWVDKVALKDRHYIFYKKKGRLITGYCSYCERDVRLKYARHNEESICPHCRTKGVFKAERMQKGLCDTVRVTYLHRGKDAQHLIERVFYVIRYYDDYRYRHPEIECFEEARFIHHNYEGNWGYFTPFYYGNYRQTGEHRWCNGFKHGYNAYRYAPEVIYTKNLSSILKNTPWQYAQLQQALKQNMNFDVGVYLTKYLQYPFMEYLFKLKLYRLLCEILNGQSSLNLNGKGFSDILGFSKTELPIMQRLDVQSSQIALVKVIFGTEGFDGTVEAMDWIIDNKLEYRIAALLEYVQCSKAKRYMDRNRGKNSYYDFTSDWLDYLSACRELGYSLDDSRLLYPSNFWKAHDEAISINDNRIAQDGNAVIEAMEDSVNSCYSYMDDNFTIRAPKSWTEILNEGRFLKHCCGASYAKRVVEGSCLILLIRKAGKPFEPFYTMEYDHNASRIMQTRGYKNASAPEEVEAFIAKWQDSISENLNRAA